jgi:hypothetical protein
MGNHGSVLSPFRVMLVQALEPSPRRSRLAFIKHCGKIMKYFNNPQRNISFYFSSGVRYFIDQTVERMIPDNLSLLGMSSALLPADR